MTTCLAFTIVLFYFLAAPGKSIAQNPAAIDTMKRKLSDAATDAEKIYWMDNLSRAWMTVNPRSADSLGKEMILFAEETRDRKLMVKAYMSNGLRTSYFKGQKAFTTKSIEFYEKSLSIAKQNKMERYTVASLLQLADVHLAIPNNDAALKYVAEAFSRSETISDDSLKVESNNVYGKVYLFRNDKILALRHYLKALRLAEDIPAKLKDEQRMKNDLMRNCYLYLSNFYTSIEDYDKAIDYQTLAYKILSQSTDKRASYQRAIDINTIGNLFSAKKNYDIAIRYFEHSIALADSLKFESLKMPGYVSLLNQYLHMDQPKKALDYLNSRQGQELKGYLNNFGMTGVIAQAYGFIYIELNRLDSGNYYMMKALPYFETNVNESSKISFYLQLARLYDKKGETNKSIEYYQKAKEMGERNGVLEVVITAAKHLDSMYSRLNQFEMASMYNGIYYKYKDSSEKLNKEKELAQVLAADEQQRLEKQIKEELDAKRRRNNIQYMAIIIGIVVLFIGLVVLGMFKVSGTLIKAIGFFVFLMLFEFIFLVFKKNIYTITHGEPWKDLAFMILLAALLVPLHHWLEHKVLHYLTSHNRLTAAGYHIKTKLFGNIKKEG